MATRNWLLSEKRLVIVLSIDEASLDIKPIVIIIVGSLVFPGAFLYILTGKNHNIYTGIISPCLRQTIKMENKVHKKILLAISLLIAGFNLNAQAAFHSPVEIFDDINGVRVVAFINREDIEKADPWKPFAGKPPLSISQALDKVRRFIHEDAKTVRVSEIELKTLPEYPHHWHYLVRLSYTSEQQAHHHYFVVLMSGKVIAAIKEPEAIK